MTEILPHSKPAGINGENNCGLQIVGAGWQEVDQTVNPVSSDNPRSVSLRGNFNPVAPFLLGLQ